MVKKKREAKAEEMEKEYNHALVKENSQRFFFCDSGLSMFRSQASAYVQVKSQGKTNILFPILFGVKQGSDLLCCFSCYSYNMFGWEKL